MPLLHALHKINIKIPIPSRRELLPYVCFALYFSLGGLVFYLLENHLYQFVDHRAPTPDRCITTIASAWFFTLACCSTIGFGVVYPCTVTGRILAIPFILFGIPQLLIVLADLGNRVCMFMVFVIRLIRACRAPPRDPPRVPSHHSLEAIVIPAQVVETPREPTPEPEVSSCPWKDFVYEWDDSEEEDEDQAKTPSIQRSYSAVNLKTVEEEEINRVVWPPPPPPEEEQEEEADIDVPIWLGVSLTLFCFFLLSTFIYYAEAHPIWEAIYGACLTYLAGDYNVMNFDYCTPAYTLVLIGFTMLSTTINIVQNNIENYMKKVKKEVDRKVKKAMEEAGGNLDPEKAELILNEVMAECQASGGMGSKFVSKMVSNKEMARTTEHVHSEIAQANLENQLADLLYHAQYTDCATQCEEVERKESALDPIWAALPPKAPTAVRTTQTDPPPVKSVVHTACDPVEELIEVPEPPPKTCDRGCDPVVAPTKSRKIEVKPQLKDMACDPVKELLPVLSNGYLDEADRKPSASQLFLESLQSEKNKLTSESRMDRLNRYVGSQDAIKSTAKTDLTSAAQRRQSAIALNNAAPPVPRRAMSAKYPQPKPITEEAEEPPAFY